MTATTTTPLPTLSGEGRLSAGIKAGARSLGALGALPGTWTGRGFNVIWRPLHDPASDHFLQLNVTSETLVFNSIGALVPNRGLVQGDIEISGVRYLQQIHDASEFPPPAGGGALHIEPGFWLNIPATTDPKAAASIVRLASIPHGNAVNAQGRVTQIKGKPTFPVLGITPFSINQPQNTVPFPEQNLKTKSKFRNPLSKQITQRLVDNPSTLLEDVIKNQTITHTTELHVDTTVFPGSVIDIPFLGPNAAVKHVSARFFIETVRNANGSQFLQLQYTQRLLLDFATLSWPHITVATLVLTGA